MTTKDDVMEFDHGVNVIVGERDAGKTKWLSMIDFLFGSDNKPEDAFGEDLARKYESVVAILEIGEEEIKLERRWKEEGSKTKIFINDVATHVDHFSEAFLKRLNLPIVRFPLGNPYSDRAWPELSWRMLYRHIYRQERFWNDLAEKQPDKEQHACLAQFLGVAEGIFPEKYGELVGQQKALNALRAQKENYLSLLSTITTDLLNQKEFSVAVTKDSIDQTEVRLRTDLARAEAARQKILDELHARVQTEERKKFDQLKELRQGLEAQIDSSNTRRAKLGKRLSELVAYSESLIAELGRLNRIRTSGKLFSDLKVTQCPVCDQPATPTENATVCYLCGKPHLDQGSANSALKRLDFEQAQISEESAELSELVKKVESEIEGIDSQTNQALALFRQTETDLTRARTMAAANLPPDLSLIEQDIGRVGEQLNQVLRVRKAFEMQDQLTKQVLELEATEKALSAEIDKETPTVDYESLSKRMEDGMNNYLNALNQGEKQRWEHGPVAFRFREKDFSVKVKGRRWDTQIGAASKAIVLFAYHYALLSLVREPQSNYPGLVIIDFPLQLADGTSIADKENYLVEPFVALCQSLGNTAQFIAAGRSFENLTGAKRLLLIRHPDAESPPESVESAESESE